MSLDPRLSLALYPIRACAELDMCTPSQRQEEIAQYEIEDELNGDTVVGFQKIARKFLYPYSLTNKPPKPIALLNKKASTLSAPTKTSTSGSAPKTTSRGHWSGGKSRLNDSLSMPPFDRSISFNQECEEYTPPENE
eukprot:2442569-Pyramimonas_sp.AAC.1